MKNNEKKSTTPKGSKDMKFLTADSNIHLIPSELRRFFTANLCNSIALVERLIVSISTDTPIFERMTDKIAIVIEKIMKIVTGCGSLFAMTAIFPKSPFLFKFVSDIRSLLLINLRFMQQLFCSVYYKYTYKSSKSQ